MTTPFPGSLRRTDAAVLDDDPFWATLRRRHPDVDLVLLPPSAADGADPRAGLDVARRQAAAVRAAWRRLESVVEQHAPGATTVGPAAGWWPVGGRYRCQVQHALRGLGAPAGRDLLGRLTLRFGKADWRLALGSRRGLPVLRAVDPEETVELRAEAGPGATVLTLRGRPLRLDPADVEVLDAEAAAWA